MQPFTHLHVHSHYSILDGASHIDKLINKVKSLGMDSIALTDHGAMYGIKEFYDTAKKAGIKPILGIETYVARRSRHNKEDKIVDARGYHLILLAKNQTGYRNLMKLTSSAFIEGFYHRPRIDRELLTQHHEGLIVTSACLGGEIPKKILQEGESAADEAIEWYKNLFGDDFYLEIMLHPAEDDTLRQDVYERQLIVNESIKRLAIKHNVKVIATNDVHFIEKEDAESHDHLICIVTGKKIDDLTRLRYTRQEYLKSTEEMQALFADYPQALENTREIVDKIEPIELKVEPLMPDFPLPDGFSTPGEYLRHITLEGARERWGNPLPTEAENRIEYELEVILKMGFSGYFLIVADFIREAMKIGVLVGPGRGSAAGSAVAYACKITNIDPLKYNLLFERFLNPDRISMPDIDIDFDDYGREKVLDYVVNKYGYNRVAQIITFGSMKAKSAIKDVGRNLSIELPKVDRITKLINADTIQKSINENPELSKVISESSPEIKNMVAIATQLEGTIRQVSTHACGVIIGPDDLDNHIPLYKDSKTNLLVTQYEGSHVESVGMLKMDFLALKTLTILKECVEYIEVTTGKVIDINNIPLDDKKTYALFGKGETTAIFQFESPGMKKYLKQLKPTVIDDLVAMNALYRPGPMAHIPSYINRKYGREKVEYDHPLMEEILKETYGITVYQEQVMLLSRKLANFTRGQSDNLRKAMGKKDPPTMEKLKTDFSHGCLNNADFIEGSKKINAEPEKLIEKIWGDWVAFTQYAFNKSHAVCYAYLAFQTAYLKAHYPSHYMAAVLSCNLDDIAKITELMDETRKMGVEIFGPDVNISFNKFRVDTKQNIRFGLAAIKGIGKNVVDHIIDIRQQKGEFQDIYDFAERIDFHIINKKVFESLAIAGALDCFGLQRSSYFDPGTGEISFVDLLHKYGSAVKNEKNTNQISLWEGMEEMDIKKPKVPHTTEWSKLETLKLEKEAIGIFLSAHPLDDYMVEIKHFTNCEAHELENLDNYANSEVSIAGMVISEQIRVTKKNDPFGRYTIADYSGNFSFTLFRDDYKKFGSLLHKDFFVLIKGSVEQPFWKKDSDGGLEFKVKEVIMLSEVREKMVKMVTLKMQLAEITDDFVADLLKQTDKSAGNVKLSIIVEQTDNYDQEQDSEDEETNHKTTRIKLFSTTKKVAFDSHFLKFINNYNAELAIN